MNFICYTMKFHNYHHTIEQEPKPVGQPEETVHSSSIFYYLKTCDKRSIESENGLVQSEQCTTVKCVTYY